MTNSPSKAPRLVLIVGAAFLGLFSAFFVFYTVRLLYVTQGLRSIRAGGGGAYAGAVVFPLLALGFGWGAKRCVRALRNRANKAGDRG